MVRKKTFFVLAFIMFFIPVQNSIAASEPFQFQDKINDTTSIFFLVALDVNQTIQVNVSQEGGGYFYLFLFDFRPNTTNVNVDKTFNDDIFAVAKVYDIPSNPSVFYNATENKIHYIQVVLLKGGPDFFTLTSDTELVRFYLPSLPGYSCDLLILSLLCSTGLSIIFLRRKKLTKITC